MRSTRGFFLPLALALAACGALPDAYQIMPTRLGLALAEASAVRADAAPLRRGDRLVFEWVSTLGDRREAAAVTLEVEEVGTPDAPRGLPEDAIETLDGLTDLWNQASLGVFLQREGGGTTLDVPTYTHAVFVKVRCGSAPERAQKLAFPIACEGRGLLPAGERIHTRLVGDRAVLSTQDLISVCVDCVTVSWLGEASAVLDTLPGMLDLDELVEKPSWLRWLFSSWNVQFPFWAGVSLGDGRVQVPLVVRCGNKDVLMGLVELAAPRGPLCLCGGITGLRLWRPSDPARELRVLLVRNERGMAPERSINPAPHGPRSVTCDSDCQAEIRLFQDRVRQPGAVAATPPKLCGRCPQPAVLETQLRRSQRHMADVATLGDVAASVAWLANCEHWDAAATPTVLTHLESSSSSAMCPPGCCSRCSRRRSSGSKRPGAPRLLLRAW